MRELPAIVWNLMAVVALSVDVVVEDDPPHAVRDEVIDRVVAHSRVRIRGRIEPYALGHPRDARIVPVPRVRHLRLDLDGPVVHLVSHEGHHMLGIGGGDHAGPARRAAGREPAVEIVRISALVIPFGRRLKRRRKMEVPRNRRSLMNLQGLVETAPVEIARASVEHVAVSEPLIAVKNERAVRLAGEGGVAGAEPVGDHIVRHRQNLEGDGGPILRRGEFPPGRIPGSRRPPVPFFGSPRSRRADTQGKNDASLEILAAPVDEGPQRRRFRAGIGGGVDVARSLLLVLREWIEENRFVPGNRRFSGHAEGKRTLAAFRVVEKNDDLRPLPAVQVDPGRGILHSEHAHAERELVGAFVEVESEYIGSFRTRSDVPGDVDRLDVAPLPRDGSEGRGRGFGVHKIDAPLERLGGRGFRVGENRESDNERYRCELRTFHDFSRASAARAQRSCCVRLRKNGDTPSTRRHGYPLHRSGRITGRSA